MSQDTSLTQSSIRGAPHPDAPLGAEGLPCLSSNISITPTNELSTQHKKSATVLALSVNKLALKFGLENLGFLTLTFRDHVVDPSEAQKRLNSLLSNVIKKRYREYLGVMERQKSGRIHYHLLLVLDKDIRQGFNFQKAQKRDYSSANPALRAEWAFWRKTAPAYRFGRSELLPIKSNEVCIARYVGKYISKHIEARDPMDKGARLVRYSRGARAGTTRFMFVSDGSAAWRRKVALFAEIVGEWFGVHVEDMDQLRAHLGPTWGYKWREFILDLPDPGEEKGAGTGGEAGSPPRDAPLGKNTESAATFDSSPSIHNDFNHLRYSSLLVSTPVISEFPHHLRESLGIDGTPENTLSAPLRDQPS